LLSGVTSESRTFQAVEELLLPFSQLSAGNRYLLVQLSTTLKKYPSPDNSEEQPHRNKDYQQENGANVRMECDERKDCGGQSVQPTPEPLNERFAFALHRASILRLPFSWNPTDEIRR
jgi:hypothetical protein